jgi:hypothetical protein
MPGNMGVGSRSNLDSRRPSSANCFALEELLEQTREQRSMQRFSLHLPVSVGGQRITAETRDVSSRGICFYSEAHLQPGSDVEFTLTLPSEITMTEEISVHCSGKVVRVDEGPDGKMAIAAQIEHYQFAAD